jgi:hypothetical protein
VVGLAAYTFIGRAHAMDVAKLTAGTSEAHTAMSVLDDLTCTVEYNDCRIKFHFPVCEGFMFSLLSELTT